MKRLIFYLLAAYFGFCLLPIMRQAHAWPRHSEGKGSHKGWGKGNWGKGKWGLDKPSSRASGSSNRGGKGNWGGNSVVSGDLGGNTVSPEQWKAILTEQQVEQSEQARQNEPVQTGPPPIEWRPPGVLTSAEIQTKLNAQLEASFARDQRVLSPKKLPGKSSENGGVPANAMEVDSLPKADVEGKIAVEDGDTFTVLLTGNHKITVQLYGVDAPELKQDFGDKAKQFTTSFLSTTAYAKVFGQQVKVHKGSEIVTVTLGWVFVGPKCLNKELVNAGFAWWSQEFAPKELKLRDLEKQARVAKVGLWSQANPTAPWEWRKDK